MTHEDVPFLAETQLEALLLSVLDSAIVATAADFGNIQIRLPASSHLKIVVQRGFQQPFLEFFRIVADPTCGCGAAMNNGQRVIVRDVESSRLYTEAGRQAMLDAGALACQSTPITVNSEIVGMLSTHYRRPFRPSKLQLSRVDRLARRAAALIQQHSKPATHSVVTQAIEEFRETSPKTRTVRGR